MSVWSKHSCCVLITEIISSVCVNGNVWRMKMSLEEAMNSVQCLTCQMSGTFLSVTVLQTPSSLSGAISPQGQIVVPASALQQGNVTVTAVNPTQVVAGMSPWHTPPSGTSLQLLLSSDRCLKVQDDHVCMWVCAPLSPCSRWHSLSACYRGNPSGSGGNTGPFSWDNTRPEQSGTAVLPCTLCTVCFHSLSV